MLMPTQASVPLMNAGTTGQGAAAGVSQAETGASAGGSFAQWLGGAVAESGVQGGTSGAAVPKLQQLFALMLANAPFGPNVPGGLQGAVEDGELSAKVDALLQSLNAMDPEQAEEWIAQPEIQALLAGLYGLLIQPEEEQPAAEEKVDLQIGEQDELDDEPQLPAEAGQPVHPALFVPLPVQGADAVTEAGKEGQADANRNGMFDLQTARELLAKWSSVSASQEQRSDGKPQEQAQWVRLAVQEAAAGLQRGSGEGQEFRLLSDGNPSAVQRLELLASKAVLPLQQIREEAPEAPLFQPLDWEAQDQADRTGVPVHEYLRNLTANHTARPGVILMTAPTFTEDFAEFVVRSFSIERGADGLAEAKISLYPQHLGQVDVKLSMQNGQLIAQFFADSLTGKEMLESQLGQLRAALLSQGIQVEKLEVSQGTAPQSGMFQDQREQHSRQPNKEQKSGNKGVYQEEDVELPERVESSLTAEPGSFDVTA